MERSGEVRAAGPGGLEGAGRPVPGPGASPGGPAQTRPQRRAPGDRTGAGEVATPQGQSQPGVSSPLPG